MRALLCILALLGSPVMAQESIITADVTLANGRLVVWRDSTGAVHLWLGGVRVFGVVWPTVPGTGVSPGAVAVPHALRAQALLMLPDTSETVFRTSLATLTLRCGLQRGDSTATCWVTVTERGRLGYWRPAPAFTAVELLKLAAAIEAARQQTAGWLWRDTLR